MGRTSRKPKAAAPAIEKGADTTGVVPSPTTTRVELDAFNHAELRANTQNIVRMIQNSRPKNTTKAYVPKQREFTEFCLSKQYCDRDTVTEDKLLLFLSECVTNRPLRAKSRTSAPGIPQSETTLSWRSVQQYVSAITDLYHAQRALGMNSHPQPRENNVRDYLKSLQRRDAEQKKASYADEGRGTLRDGYTEQEFERVCHELWAHTTTGSAEGHLRTLVDLLLGHYMLTRGSDRRAAEISDIFTLEIPGEGPTRCMPLIWTSRAGKENQHGWLETAGAFRNRKPLICILSGLAFYLLFRWDLSQEPFPDFGTREAWYHIPLVKASNIDRTAAISYNTQREWAVKAFQYANIASKKKTHIDQSLGAKTAELKGVSEDQIRRAGPWSSDEIAGCYLNSLPRRFMRTMAGHPAQMGCFEIRRAGVAPPPALLSMIWPKLDDWKDRFGPSTSQLDDPAAMGLIDLLLYLREVVLQDSVILMRQYPGSPVWGHPAFQHPAYKAFAQEVAVFVQEEERPSQLAVLTQAMPVLSDYLKSIDARNEARIMELTARLQAMEERLLQAQTQQSSQAHSLLTAGLTVHLQAATPQLTTATAPALTPAPAPAPAPALAREGSSYSSACSNLGSRSSSPAPVAANNEEERPPRYRMSRKVKTVTSLWREWTAGLQGQPAIIELDRKWGNRWRSGRQSELQWYSLRLEVIKEIRHVAQAQRVSEEAAVLIVDLDQQQTGCSIDQLCKRLRARRKARSGNSKTIS